VKAFAVSVLALGFLAGCSSGNNNQQSSSPPAPAPKAASEAKTGRAAFQEMYIAARGWSGDVLPFEEDSQPTSDATGTNGTSAVWNASFGSASKNLFKVFTWSGSTDPGAPSRGVSQTSQSDYSPNNSSTHAFNLGFVKSDSDDAFKVAQEHGGKKLLEKNKDLPIFYKLWWDASSNSPFWHVSYGGTGRDSKLTVAVNATTGQFVRVEH
jgi:hypothetical protein